MKSNEKTKSQLSDDELRLLFDLCRKGGDVGEAIRGLPLRDENTARRVHRAVSILEARGIKKLDKEKAMDLADEVGYRATGKYMLFIFQKLKAWTEVGAAVRDDSDAVEFEVMPQVHRAMAKLNVRNCSNFPVVFKATAKICNANVDLHNGGLYYPVKWLGTKSENVEVASDDVGVLDVVALGIPKGMRLPIVGYLPGNTLCLNFLVAGNIEGAPHGYFSEGCQSDRQFRKGNGKNVQISISVSIHGTSTVDSSINKIWEGRFRVSPGDDRDSIVFEQTEIADTSSTSG